MANEPNEAGRTSSGPDYSYVDSLAKARELCALGQLEKLLLMPPEFGGEDIPQNVTYVPLGFAAMKAGIDQNVVGPLAAQGKVTRYAATPEYQGRSFVPTAINIMASTPEEFSATVRIWGQASIPDQKAK